MAHELETLENGSASMAYIGEVPWHGLGTNLPLGATSREMMTAAGLDWEVEKFPSFYTTKSGQQYLSPQSALVRLSDNKLLDMVSNDWNPVQNQEAFDFFNEFVADKSMYLETAGSLKGGQYVWAMAKANESFELFNGKDRVDSYLLFTNPHKYGSSIDIRFTATRVVCHNTLTAALGSSSKNVFRASHRNKFDAEKAKDLMGLSHSKLLDYKQRAEVLAERTYQEEDVVTYFRRLFPSLSQDRTKMSKSAETVTSLLHTQPGAQLGDGSWWQAFNAVTYYVDHVAGRSQDNRVFSSWLGSGSEKKADALNLAIQMSC